MIKSANFYGFCLVLATSVSFNAIAVMPDPDAINYNSPNAHKWFKDNPYARFIADIYNPHLDGAKDILKYCGLGNDKTKVEEMFGLKSETRIFSSNTHIVKFFQDRFDCEANSLMDVKQLKQANYFKGFDICVPEYLFSTSGQYSGWNIAVFKKLNHFNGGDNPLESSIKKVIDGNAQTSDHDLLKSFGSALGKFQESNIEYIGEKLYVNTHMDLKVNNVIVPKNGSFTLIDIGDFEKAKSPVIDVFYYLYKTLCFAFNGNSPERKIANTPNIKENLKDYFKDFFTGYLSSITPKFKESVGKRFSKYLNKTFSEANNELTKEGLLYDLGIVAKYQNLFEYTFKKAYKFAFGPQSNIMNPMIQPPQPIAAPQVNPINGLGINELANAVANPQLRKAPAKAPVEQQPEPPKPVFNLRPVAPVQKAPIVQQQPAAQQKPVFNLRPVNPAPAVKAAPAPVVKAAPAPVKAAPAPVVKAAPAPVVKAAPAPVVKAAPAPVVKAAPAPVVKAAPAPVKAAPAPVVKAAPAPVKAAPAPAVAQPKPVVVKQAENRPLPKIPAVKAAPAPVVEAAPAPDAQQKPAWMQKIIQQNAQKNAVVNPAPVKAAPAPAVAQPKPVVVKQAENRPLPKIPAVKAAPAPVKVAPAPVVKAAPAPVKVAPAPAVAQPKPNFAELRNKIANGVRFNQSQNPQINKLVQPQVVQPQARQQQHINHEVQDHAAVQQQQHVHVYVRA